MMIVNFKWFNLTLNILLYDDSLRWPWNRNYIEFIYIHMIWYKILEQKRQMFNVWGQRFFMDPDKCIILVRF